MYATVGEKFMKFCGCCMFVCCTRTDLIFYYWKIIFYIIDLSEILLISVTGKYIMLILVLLCMFSLILKDFGRAC